MPQCRRCTGWKLTGSKPVQGRGDLYTYTEAQMLQRRLAGLARKRGPHRQGRRCSATRGSGEMDADQLAETTMDPRRRSLRRITADDADAARRVFELLMGSDVAPRKEFIVANGGHLSDDELDF